MEKRNNYFKVTAKCGHVGKSHYIPITFPVCAGSGKEAAALARNFPRVKHDHRDAILSCEKISYSEFVEINEMNNNDPYLHCKNRKEQKRTCDLSSRIVSDTHCISVRYDSKERSERIKYKAVKMFYKYWDNEDFYMYA